MPARARLFRDRSEIPLWLQGRLLPQFGPGAPPQVELESRPSRMTGINFARQAGSFEARLGRWRPQTPSPGASHRGRPMGHTQKAGWVTHTSPDRKDSLKMKMSFYKNLYNSAI